jgi:hypothetical protein
MNYTDREDFKKQMLEYIKNENKEWLYFIIPEDYTLKLTSYASMKNDLYFLKEATKKLIEIHKKYPRPEDNFDLIVEPALWYSVIVLYARLFTEAFDKRSKLEVRDVFEIPDEEKDPLYWIHKELMEDRNNFVAHRGDSELDNFMVLFKLPKSGDLSKAQFDINTVRAYAKGTSFFVEYLKLFEKISGIVDLKMQIQSDKLSKMISRRPLDFLKPHQV